MDTLLDQAQHSELSILLVLQIVQRLLDVGAGEEYKTLPDDMIEPVAEVEQDGVASRRQVNSPLLWAAYKVRI
jgi:uncharacterized membrane-anchored protein